jgi:hypothetical protein
MLPWDLQETNAFETGINQLTATDIAGQHAGPAVKWDSHQRAGAILSEDMPAGKRDPMLPLLAAGWIFFFWAWQPAGWDHRVDAARLLLARWSFAARRIFQWASLGPSTTRFIFAARCRTHCTALAGAHLTAAVGFSGQLFMNFCYRAKVGVALRRPGRWRARSRTPRPPVIVGPGPRASPAVFSSTGLTWLAGPGPTASSKYFSFFVPFLSVKFL